MNDMGPKKESSDDMLSPKEVAEFLGVNVETIRRWAFRGELRAYWYGRLIRIRRGDMMAKHDRDMDRDRNGGQRVFEAEYQ